METKVEKGAGMRWRQSLRVLTCQEPDVPQNKR